MAEVIRVPFGFVSAFLVRGEKVILVDAGVPSGMARLRRAMDAHGIKPSEVSLILLTHGHTDHAGGANAARQLTGAKVAMHRACAENLRHGRLPVSPPRTTMAWVLQNLFGRLMKVEPVEPDIEIDDEFDLRPFGMDGKAVPTPGHTSGCLSVFLSDGQAIVGDLLAGRRKGRGAMLPMFLWDSGKLGRSLERVVKEAPTIIHNAHGDACPLAACRALLESMRTTV